jgi:hypothetical protein
MRKMTLLLAAVSTFGISGTANATFTIFTNQAAFLAAVTNVGVDTFDNFSNTSSTPSPINRNAGPYNYTGTVTTTSFFGAGSGADHWLSTNTATDTMTFSAFTGGVQAAGGNFFGSDVAGLFLPGSIVITATDANGTSSQTITNATTTSFLGFVSTNAISALTVTSVQPTNGSFLWPTVNNLTLAQRANATPAVPEPASWAMMIAGFGLVGGAMRRRTTVRFAAA